MGLKYMLDTLFEKMDLKTWTIFEDKSGATSVRLRFQNSGDGVSNNSVERVTSFKRKSPAQLDRDRRRAEHHRVTTRSQATRDRQHQDDIDISSWRHELAHPFDPYPTRERGSRVDFPRPHAVRSGCITQRSLISSISLGLGSASKKTIFLNYTNLILTCRNELYLKKYPDSICFT